MLAFAGACVAGLPWVPEIDMQPRLALALFIAPALLDAAYDLPPRELRRDWLPLTWLALVAVVLTAAAVAAVAWAWEGMPLAAAIALGAIVAPPDAAAAAAVLTKFPLAIWEIVVFVLNVLAFLLMGLQARTILARLDSARLWEAIWFAVTVLMVVIVVRIIWVMTGTLIPRLFQRRDASPSTTIREAVLMSWCGMRGLVTLATAFAARENLRFHRLEEELDWAELHASPREELDCWMRRRDDRARRRPRPVVDAYGQVAETIFSDSTLNCCRAGAAVPPRRRLPLRATRCRRPRPCDWRGASD